MISSGSDRAIPIGRVVPFGGRVVSHCRKTWANIVSDDLRNSGVSSPIPRQNMLSQPSQASEVIFRDWKALGANYVLVGNIVPNGGRLQINTPCSTFPTEQQVLTGNVGGGTDQLRDMDPFHLRPGLWKS